MDPNVFVNIPDANLRAAIEEALDKTAGAPITATALRTLTSLDSKQSLIQNLTSLEFATNLRTLSLSDNQISDVSPLANLVNLGELDLDSNQIADISPLANLTNLTVLSLSNNHISDISPLAGLKNLSELDLDSNQIADISPLANLTNLSALDLSINPILDFSVIDGLLPNLVRYSNDNQTQQQPGIEPLVVSDPQVNIYWVQAASSEFGPTSIWRANLEMKTIQAIVPNVWASDLTIDPAGGKIYWINTTRTPSGEMTDIKIQWANLDGSDPQDFFIPDGQVIEDLTLDGVGGIYWINRDWNTGSHKIQRANLDGSNVQDILANIHPWEFAIDPVSGTIYWVDWLGQGVDKIRRAHLDGSNIQDFYTTAANPVQLIIDSARQKIYWEDVDYSTDESTAIIRRANLNGSNIETLFTTALLTPLTLDSLRNTMYLGTGSAWASSWGVTWSNLDRSDNISFSDFFSEFFIPWTESGSPHLTVDEADGTLYWTEYDETRGNFGIGRRTLDGEAEKIIMDVDYGISALVVAAIPPQGPDLRLIEPPLLASQEQDYILHGFIGQEGQIDGVTFSPDGRTLASIDVNGILLHLDPHALRTNPRLTEDVDQVPWDIELREAQTLKQERGSRSVAYSPNGWLLALGTSDKTIVFWDVGTATQMYALPAPKQVWAVVFSPDGTTLASGGSYDGIRLWDVRQAHRKPPEVKSILRAETAQVEGIAFHPDGQTLAVATGKRDEVVHLWDLQTETLKDTLTVPQVSVRKIAFSPDGRMLAGGAYSTGGQYGQGQGVLLWKQAPLPPETLANLMPHSVELSGPTVVGPGRSYTFTVRVKNARGAGVANALVSTNVPNLQTYGINNVTTDNRGNAKVLLQFPEVGKHDIDVTVLERVSQQELKRTFPDRVEVPKPHSIAAAVTQPKPRELGNSYTDAFIIESEDGRRLEGFNVNIRIVTTSRSFISDDKGKARFGPSRLFLVGEHDVDVAVLASGPNSQELLKRTFRRRAVFYDSCAAQMPGSSAQLQAMPIRPLIRQEQISREKNIKINKVVGYGYAPSVAGAPAAPGTTASAHRLNWTTHDTVNPNDKKTLILSVAFLNSTDRSQEDHIIEVANQWRQQYGNFKFVRVSKDAPSDIRVLINDEGINRSALGWFSHHAAKRSDPKAPTMLLSRKNPAILHEFGHALGLLHEHLSSRFRESFQWTLTGDEFYKEICQRYSYGLTRAECEAPRFFNPPKDSKEETVKRSIFTNFLDNSVLSATTDLKKGHFDPDSIMTYALDADMIKLANPKTAPYWAQKVAAEGVKKNTKLSVADVAFISRAYGKLNTLVITGEIDIWGKDDEDNIFELFGSDQNEYDDITVKVNESYDYYPVEYLPELVRDKYLLDKVAELKWGGECRVEVYLGHRKASDAVIEMAAIALLYEGIDVDTDDLEDIVIHEFELTVDDEEKSFELEKLVNEDNFFNIDDATNVSAEYVISFDESGWRGDFAGGGDEATVTLRLQAHNASEDRVSHVEALSPPATNSTLSEDVNADGQVNVADLILVANYLNQPAPEKPLVDVNDDGTVAIADLVQVARYLGQSTTSAAPARIVVPAGLKYATVEAWIHEARLEDDGSPSFNQGIANLAYLLTLIIPEKTALLPNYPNPFNPETWIPYHLSEPADVTLTIYAVNGQVARHLDLGHQAAGYYQSKSRAAYWDGRNHVGERVASGLYFYTLTAGDFSATRKMLIMK